MKGGLIGLTLFVFLAAVGPEIDGCPRVRSERRSLNAPLDSARRTVWACEKNNVTGIWIERGLRYRFRTEGRWYDKSIPADGRGYTLSSVHGLTKGFLFLSTLLRRVWNANWFELVGEVPAGSKHYVRIGSLGDSVWTAPFSGELAAFANDVGIAYGNNSGSVELVVTRVP